MGGRSAGEVHVSNGRVPDDRRALRDVPRILHLHVDAGLLQGRQDVGVGRREIRPQRMVLEQDHLIVQKEPLQHVAQRQHVVVAGRQHQADSPFVFGRRALEAADGLVPWVRPDLRRLHGVQRIGGDVVDPVGVRFFLDLGRRAFPRLHGDEGAQERLGHGHDLEAGLRRDHRGRSARVVQALAETLPRQLDTLARSGVAPPGRVLPKQAQRCLGPLWDAGLVDRGSAAVPRHVPVAAGGKIALDLPGPWPCGRPEFLQLMGDTGAPAANGHVAGRSAARGAKGVRRAARTWRLLLGCPGWRGRSVPSVTAGRRRGALRAKDATIAAGCVFKVDGGHGLDQRQESVG
eukprot:scaffold1154_cov310-Pinguiococcus_pyrenoidosus.AAC.28